MTPPDSALTPPPRADNPATASAFEEAGRAYVQGLAPVFVLAALGHGEFVPPAGTSANEVLASIGAARSINDLHQFLAAAAVEVELLLQQLVERPLRPVVQS